MTILYIPAELKTLEKEGRGKIITPEAMEAALPKSNCFGGFAKLPPSHIPEKDLPLSMDTYRELFYRMPDDPRKERILKLVADKVHPFKEDLFGMSQASSLHTEEEHGISVDVTDTSIEISQYAVKINGAKKSESSDFSASDSDIAPDVTLNELLTDVEIPSKQTATVKSVKSTEGALKTESRSKSKEPAAKPMRKDGLSNGNKLGQASRKTRSQKAQSLQSGAKLSEGLSDGEELTGSIPSKKSNDPSSSGNKSAVGRKTRPRKGKSPSPTVSQSKESGRPLDGEDVTESAHDKTRSRKGKSPSPTVSQSKENGRPLDGEDLTESAHDKTSNVKKGPINRRDRKKFGFRTVEPGKLPILTSTPAPPKPVKIPVPRRITRSQTQKESQLSIECHSDTTADTASTESGSFHWSLPAQPLEPTVSISKYFITSMTTWTKCPGLTCVINIVKPRFLFKIVDLWSYTLPIDRYSHTL